MKTFKEYIRENEEANAEEEDKIHYPGGVYISVKMQEESIIAMEEYCSKYLPGLEINKEWHSTLIYSKKVHKEEIIPASYTAVCTVLHFSKFGKEGETLVAELDCPVLTERNIELVEEYGFISDFDEYKPHTTLVYDAQDVDINSLPEIDFALYFDSEEVEQLDTDWNGTGSSEDSEDDFDEENATIAGKALNAMKKAEEKNKKEDKDSDNEEDKD
jgi:hypothetical protein